MGTVTITLPDDLRAFVEEQAAAGHHASRSDYMGDLLRREADRQRLHALLLEGGNRRWWGQPTRHTSSGCARVSEPARDVSAAGSPAERDIDDVIALHAGGRGGRS